MAPALYFIDTLLGILLLVQLVCIAMQFHYHKPALFVLENTSTAIAYITVTLASFIHTYLFLVMSICLCAVILLILPTIVIYRKQPNATSLFLNRCNLLFGYILLAGAFTVQPLFPLTDINLIAISPNLISKILPGVDWTMALSNLYLSYPLFYLIGTIAALLAYWQKKKILARYLILLPLIPIFILVAAWIVIAVHYALTDQFYIALTL